MNYYIVNQGETFKEEFNGGYIWAPKTKECERNVNHWSILAEIQKGDIILSNSNGKIVSINIAKGSCYDADNPFDTLQWKKEGRKVDINYFILQESLSYSDYLDVLLDLQGKKGAFNRRSVNQGYVFPLTKGQFDYLYNLVKIKTHINEIEKIICEEEQNDLMEYLEEEKQYRDIFENCVKPYTEKELEELEREEQLRSNQHPKFSKRPKTDARLKATCLEKANYQCEVSEDHVTFSSTKGLHQYAECHHLIPLKGQKDFKNFKLDKLFNLICLCPLCHAQIHYGNRLAKEEIFWNIYKKHRKDLKLKGINKKEMEKIFNKYYF